MTFRSQSSLEIIPLLRNYGVSEPCLSTALSATIPCIPDKILILLIFVHLSRPAYFRIQGKLPECAYLHVGLA